MENINEKMISYIYKEINNASLEYKKGILNKGVEEIIDRNRKIHIIAVGSSFNAAKAAKEVIINKTNKLIFEYLAEGFIQNNKVYENDVYLLISQSGISKSVIKAYDKIKEKNDNIILLTENFESFLGKRISKKILIQNFTEEFPFKTIGFFNTYLKLLMMFGIKIPFDHYDIKNIFKENFINGEMNKFLNKLSDNSEITILYDNAFEGFAKELQLKIIEMSWVKAVIFEIEDFCHGKDAYISKKDSFIFISNMNEKLVNVIKDHIKKNANDNFCNIANFIKDRSINEIILNLIILSYSQLLSIKIKEKLRPESTSLKYKELVNFSKEGKWE